MPTATPGWLFPFSVFSFLAAALLYLPFAVFFRYATVSIRQSGPPILLAFTASFLLAAVNEASWRGWFFKRVQKTRLPAGVPVMLTALLGSLPPLAFRLEFFPVPRVSPSAVTGHAFLVEAFLSLGLTWLALGTGTFRPGAVALGILWSFRFGLEPRFHGGVFPVMELWAAIFAALAVCIVLHKPLSPYREELFGGE